MTASSSTAHHHPLVCGALGDYDPTRVRAIARAFGGDRVRVVHEDATSALALDREPLRWGSGASPVRTQGLGWIEATPWPGDRPGSGVTTWQEASRAGACGLVLDGEHRYLHTSVNGLGSVYWLSEGEAVYFSSRIDPLVQATPGEFSIDWDAWASIIVMRFALRDLTPFAEIGRLPPYTTFGWHRGQRGGHLQVESPTWPWAEAEPSVDRQQTAAALAQALRDAVALVPGPVLVPLSGGRDSRLLACVLAEAGKAARTVSVSDDEGDTYEEDLAAAVAEALGLSQDRLAADPGAYPSNWEARARLVEHQFVDHAWLVPLSQYVARQPLPISDGFAMDALLGESGRFYSQATQDRSDPRRATRGLFDRMRRYGHAQLALADPLREPLLARSSELFDSVAAPFEGSPRQSMLTFIRTRTMRGVACYPTGLLGQRAEVFAPAATQAFALAALSATDDARAGDGLYDAVYAELAPEIAALPSTRTAERVPPHLPRAWRGDASVSAHRRRLAQGPLTQYVAPELRAWLTALPRPELSGDLRLGLEGISLLHSWWWRYRGRLREVDARDLLG